jgi:hypothetical protein
MGDVNTTLDKMYKLFCKVYGIAEDFSDEGDTAGDNWEDAGERARKAWDWVDGDGGGGGRDGGGRGNPRGGGYAEGGIAWIPQLARIAEHEPEIIMPLRDYRADAIPAAGAGGRNSNVNVTFNIRALDGTDMINVVRSKVVPILQNILNHNGLRVPTGVVGG